jgi:hypothetical protein
MTSVERAFQQLDPLGALVGRPVSLGAAVGIPTFAIWSTWITQDEVQYWAFAVAAIAAISTSGVLLVVGSNPLRAPFTLRWHILVTGFAVLAYVLSVISTWDTNQRVRDDWAPISLGLILLSLSQYRPPKEIASTGLVLGLFAGVLALAQAHSLSPLLQPIVYSIVVMIPILSLSLASAAFARVLIDGLDRWRRSASSAVSSFGVQNTGWIARSVQQDRVTILNQEVIPFFTEVLEKGTIDYGDRERARSISDAIRGVMVSEADRTWLDIIVAEAVPGGASVSDPSRLVTFMGADQRTAVRAVIVALAAHPSFRQGTLAIELEADGNWCRSMITSTVETTDNVVRGEFAPYLAVMRIVFSDLRVEFSGTTLTLRFLYER